MIEDVLKDAIRRSVDCTRDSFVSARIPVVEEDYAEECLVSVLVKVEF